MGKRKGGGNRRDGGNSGSSKPKVSQRWDALPETNEAFVKYYKAQGIIDGADAEGGCPEWDEFFKSLKTDLPTTFRITGNKSNIQQISDAIQNTYLPFLSSVEVNGEQLPPPFKLPWYPGGLAWQLNVAKQTVRKSPEFKRFQNFLVYETEAGNLSRQEAVSMIPPLLLDVKPHHYVLDCCAAPGSKTAQLLEALHAQSESEHTATVPSGILIANDSDYKRSQLLVHQSLRRIPSPSMMVTNLDASLFPSLKVPFGLERAEEGAPAIKEFTGDATRITKLKFDRILCDVPCSGEGTIRKNPQIWRDWTVGNAMGLHPLQLRIITRAIALLRPGSRLVYSTCSINPVENEAVVSAALAANPDLSLVDVSSQLPELKRRPGMTKWKVMKRDLSGELESVDDLVGKDMKRKYAATLWPDGKEEERGLDRCLRLYPHLQDTGGFFVAVLEKAVRSVPDAPTATEIAGEATATEDVVMTNGENTAADVAVALPPSKRRADDRSSPVRASDPKRVKPDDAQAADIAATDSTADEIEPTEPAAVEETVIEADLAALPEDFRPAKEDRVFKEEPYTFLASDDEQVKTCCDFFHLIRDFPSGNLLVRNATGEPLRSIYLTSTLTKHIVQANPYTKMRLVCCGVRLFARQDSQRQKDEAFRCKWRIVSDGTRYFRPFMGPARVVQCSLRTLRQLMDGEVQNPLFADLQEARFRTAVEALDAGSCVVEVEPGEDEGAVLKHTLVVGLWISKSSVNLMSEKKEKSALSLRLWGIDHATKAKNAGWKSGADKKVTEAKAAEEVVDEAGQETGVQGEKKATETEKVE